MGIGVRGFMNARLGFDTRQSGSVRGSRRIKVTIHRVQLHQA